MPSSRLPGPARRGHTLISPAAKIDFAPAQSRSRAIRIAVVVFVLVVAVAIAAAVLWGFTLSRSLDFTAPGQAQQIQAELASVPGQSYNVLIAATDTTSAGAAGGTDTLIFAYVNPLKNQAWLLWVPPDIQTTVKGLGTITIGDARLRGGPAETIKAFQELTGLPVTNYAEVDFSAIRKAVDSVGGVWVNVPQSLETTGSAAGGSRTAARVDAGSQLLDGARAMTLLRAQPPLAQQAYPRMADQQLVVNALASAIAPKIGSLGGLQVFAAAAPWMHSTMGPSQLLAFAKALRAVGPSGIHSATIPGTWKPSRVIPDTAALTRLVADMRAGRPFDVPAATLAKAAADSVAVASNKSPSQVSVTVQNGGGIAGAAKQAAGVLQTQGFHIAGTGNANLNVYPKTLVIYKSDVRLANLVAQYLPPGTRTVQSFGFYSFKSDVLVIVGKDWDIGKVPAAKIVTQ